MSWHTVCVSYYDDDKDDLILDAVRPLFAGLSTAVTGAHFLRHWRRGPHLRLNVRTTGAAMAAEVLPAVDGIVGGFLAAHPSTSAVDPQALLPEHRKLAKAEQDTGPLWPWRPDNTVSVEPYDCRAHVLGGREAAEAIADFYAATSGSAFAATEAVRAGQQRLWLAFELMVATSHAFAAEGLRRGYVSFRAHAEVFLAGTGAADRWRADWDRRYALAVPALLDRLAGITAAVDGERDCPPVVAGWLAALREFRRRGYPLVESGELRLDHAPAGPPPPGASPFLRELVTNREFHERLLPSPGFRRYRLLVNLLYLQLTRLGIRPVDRYLLAHFAANAAEDLYAVDAIQSLRSNVRVLS